VPASQKKPWWRLPAFQALLIQCGSLVLVLAFFFTARAIGVDVPLTGLLICQGVIAAAVSYKRQLAPWWPYIQFFFPIALGATQALHLPSEIFLVCFLFLAALFWTTFRTQVPFYPSRRPVWVAVAGLLPQDRPVAMLDVGSGLGGLTCYLAACQPNGRFTGIEVAPLLWLLSRFRQFVGPENCRFIRGDYNRLYFAQYDVLFAYLSGVAMPALWEKARREMRPGTLLLSYEFQIPDISPHIQLMPESDGPFLYGWYM
jgi:hypothetical protein